MPLRVTEREEALGLDVTQHGEEAYVTGEGAILVTPESGYRDPVRSRWPAAGYAVARSGDAPARIQGDWMCCRTAGSPLLGCRAAPAAL